MICNLHSFKEFLRAPRGLAATAALFSHCKSLKTGCRKDTRYSREREPREKPGCNSFRVQTSCCCCCCCCCCCRCLSFVPLLSAFFPFLLCLCLSFVALAVLSQLWLAFGCWLFGFSVFFVFVFVFFSCFFKLLIFFFFSNVES